MHNPILDLFNFLEKTIIYGDVYCEILELCSEILPQLYDVEAEKGLIFFQQGALYFPFTKPHYSHATLNF